MMSHPPPVAVSLDRLADFLIGEHVDGLEGRAQLFEDLHRRGRESAHREVSRALHEDQNLVAGNRGLNLIGCIRHPAYLRF
jgi:uncharacterized iron-regulated membrane protein